jgi:glycosyltransferase involved in cell wall biosynthesis
MNNVNPASLAVVIPAFNEAATIAAVVGNAARLGHVVVVNDGSRDDTEALARAAGAAVLTLPGNQGYEGALSAGMKHAIDKDFDFALTMDADGQHRLESAQALIAAIQDRDLAIGIRHKKQRVTELFAGWIGSLLWGIDDPFSGLKLYRLTTCKELGAFDSRRLVGAEMMVRAYRKGLKIVPIPIQTAERADSPRFGSLLRSNYRLARATVLLVGISWGLLR